MMKLLVASRPNRPSGRLGHPVARWLLDNWTTPGKRMHSRGRALSECASIVVPPSRAETPGTRAAMPVTDLTSNGFFLAGNV